MKPKNFKTYWRLPFMLGWQDLTQYYKRSVLGPFWISAGMLIQILTMSVVFGLLFKIELSSYLPLLATGLIIWNFMSGCLTDGTNSIIQAEYIIKQIVIPFPVHPLRAIWKNILIMAHNAIILPFVLLFCGVEFSFNSLLFIPGFILVTINISWIAVLLSLLGARFRDLPPMVTAGLTVLVYITPVMWSPSSIPESFAKYLLSWNPFYHFLQISRQPLLGIAPDPSSWAVCLILGVLGILITFEILNRFQKQIPYWV